MSKIVLIGAGSLQFGTGMLGDIFQSSVLADANIVLHDINEAAALRTLTVAQAHIEAKALKQTISVARDLKQALAGADFVIISIEVGDRFKLWDMDWRIPQQYGIPQIYGENGGPGGLFHSLRIIPPILEICRAIAEQAPDAWVFNFSNPMSRICTTVHRAFPELRFVGMCHEIASLERHLAPALGTTREQIRFRAAGLNHFSVLASVEYASSGEDAYDDVRRLAPAYFSKQIGYSEILNYSREHDEVVETEGWMDIDLSGITQARDWSDRWLFRDVLQHFGVLPITGDSHFGEYIQWAHEVSDHRGIIDFYTLYRHHLNDIEPAIRDEIHERVVPIIEGLLTGKRYEEAAVNIPNNGYIAGLPEWLVVEVPADIDENGIEGIAVELPPGFRGLLSNQIGVHDLTAEAVLNGSRDLAIQALLVDPVVPISRDIPDLVDHMVREQSPWLDYLS